jgi:hypothetical protein
VTPFSTSGLVATQKRYALVSNFLATQAGHGWTTVIAQGGPLLHAAHKAYSPSTYVHERTERAVRLMDLHTKLAMAKSVGK